MDLFISSDLSICSTVAFPPLRNSDIVVVSVSIDFPPNSKRGVSFQCTAYDYSLADLDGLFDHLRAVLCEDTFKLDASMAAAECCSGSRLELMYIFLILNIRSNLIHFHSFQLLMLVEMISFVCTNRIDEIIWYKTKYLTRNLVRLRFLLHFLNLSLVEFQVGFFALFLFCQ